MNTDYIASGSIFVRVGPNTQKLIIVKEMRYIMDDKLMGGSLIDQYHAAIAYLQSKLELQLLMPGMQMVSSKGW